MACARPGAPTNSATMPGGLIPVPRRNSGTRPREAEKDSRRGKGPGEREDGRGAGAVDHGGSQSHRDRECARRCEHDQAHDAPEDRRGERPLQSRHDDEFARAGHTGDRRPAWPRPGRHRRRRAPPQHRRPSVAGEHVPGQRHRIAGIADRRRRLAADEQPEPPAAARPGVLRSRFPLVAFAYAAGGRLLGGQGDRTLVPVLLRGTGPGPLRCDPVP